MKRFIDWLKSWASRKNSHPKVIPTPIIGSPTLDQPEGDFLPWEFHHNSHLLLGSVPPKKFATASPVERPIFEPIIFKSEIDLAPHKSDEAARIGSNCDYTAALRGTEKVPTRVETPYRDQDSISTVVAKLIHEVDGLRSKLKTVKRRALAQQTHLANL